MISDGSAGALLTHPALRLATKLFVTVTGAGATLVAQPLVQIEPRLKIVP